MKSKDEINREIKSLNKQQDKLYKRKKRAESNSSTMRFIDSEIDKNGAKIRTLKWVMDS